MLIVNKSFVQISILTLLFILISGCAVFMAAKQPDAKNIDLFRVGIPRSMLLAEFGLPMASEVRDGKKTEIFKFVQGYSAGAKAGRAVFHGVADVLTIGLWEVVGTPTEGVFNGNEMVYEVSYDDNDKVDQVIALKK
ncbi:Beta-barrel assembly machine subunit BamE [Nitrosomonas ureae]|uniref:Beta-barrel assembly machine subunit BamE n=2 Tax=Nitrosomonas ureae TaxID=44577 RepID=A0A286A708_9PROT|nr:Beta-barrel assembly machine subunit BamE [Nitrosomonas ureae]